jgi:hypothetical protein
MGLECSAWRLPVYPGRSRYAIPVMAAQTAAHASNADLSGRRPRLDENPCGPDSRSTWEVVIGSRTLQVLSYALRRIWRPGRLGIAVWPGRLGLGMGSVCILRSARPCQRDPQLAGRLVGSFLRAFGNGGLAGLVEVVGDAAAQYSMSCQSRKSPWSRNRRIRCSAPEKPDGQEAAGR